MAGNRISRTSHGRTIGGLTLAAALLWGQAAAAADPHSSPQDRQRFVSIARSLERAPLDPALKPDLGWGVAWLTEAPDVNVTACLDTLPGLFDSKYRYGSEIVVENLFAMGAFAIEHPEAANDPSAQQLAGIEGALSAYRAILKDKPNARSAALDALLQTQSRGELPEFARTAWKRCSAKK